MSQVRIAILDDYQGVALQHGDWASLGDRVHPVVFRDHLHDPDLLIDRLLEFPVVVAMRERTSFPRQVLERLPNLRLLLTAGMHNAVIDDEACADLGITYCGTSGTGSGTPELTWALILACKRHIPTEVANVRSGGWMTTVGTELYRSTLGLCGLGYIGARVARVAKAFGMNVIAWSQNLTEERCAKYDATLVTKDELVARADVLSVHLVLSERTEGIIGEPELRQMKRTAILINTSRGPLVDEAALARACREGWIAGAGLDAYGVEPLPPHHPFRTLPNVVATPHIGYVTDACYDVFFRDFVEDIGAWLDGAPVRLITQ